MGKKLLLRKIIVDGQEYVWAFRPHYELDQNGRYVCHDIFTAYLQQIKRNPLSVHFITWESPIEGGPLRGSAPINLDNAESGNINLYQPKLAAQIIRQGLLHGWNPSENRSLVIEDGLQLLAEIGYPVK